MTSALRSRRIATERWSFCADTGEVLRSERHLGRPQGFSSRYAGRIASLPRCSGEADLGGSAAHPVRRQGKKFSCVSLHIGKACVWDIANLN
jgi:hypothetical protein